MKFGTGLIVSALASLLLWQGSALGDVYGAKQRFLENGMQVVVVENHRAPVVTHMVWYRVGALDEPPGKSGIAHFLEHLMFKGTDTLAPGEFSQTVARNGGDDNAFTSQDYTAYYQSVASDRLELVMRLEADRMANLKIDEAHFEPEKQVVLEERNQRTDSEPGAILREQAASAFYRNHPYAVPIIGWRHEIEALKLQDAIDFYETHYVPNNAILVVSGDVDAEEVFALAETYYGVIPAGPLPSPPVLQEPPLLVKTTVELEDPRVRQPSVSFRKSAPGLQDVDRPDDLYPYDILNEILGGGSTSALYRALVIDQGVAVSAGSWYDSGGRGPAQFGFYISPAPDTPLGDAEAALRAEVERILEEGISEEDVQKAIIRLQDSAATALDSLSGPAMTLGRTLTTGWTLEQVESWPEDVGAVTVEQVNAAFADVFASPGEVINRLLPQGHGEEVAQ